MERQIYHNLLDDVTLDLCFEMHGQISLDGLSLEEMYDVEPIERLVETPVVKQDSVFVSCLHCKRQVHASRYTNHLEKCLTGSRRMITPKQRQDAARETERKQLQVLRAPQLYRTDVSKTRYDQAHGFVEAIPRLRALVAPLINLVDLFFRRLLFVSSCGLVRKILVFH